MNAGLFAQGEEQPIINTVNMGKKKLLIINGVPGIGKTTVCRQLNKSLEQSVWLDGDWCWMMHPWNVTEENKRMVEDNITHLLRNFLMNSTFEYVIFNWVIPREIIFDILLERLQDLEFDLYKFTLICSEEALCHRMKVDNRSNAQIEQSIARLEEYRHMDTIKIDADQSINEVVKQIIEVAQ